jgi:16S rRNA (uracil1498-N3)-methyltransferase
VSRFFVSSGDVKGDKITVTGREARHIAGVLRHKANDEVIAFDERGSEYSGVIESAGKKEVIISVKKKREPVAVKEGARITLAQAIPKKSKFDHIVEKSTELGVCGIIPLVTERTIVKIKDGAEEKIKRWKKVSIEASKQCGRRKTPEISGIRSFPDALSDAASYDLWLIACLQKDTRPLAQALGESGDPGSVIIFIGPEGDFSANETKEAVSRGAVAVSMGPLVLKTDTAAIAALSAINCVLKRF